MFNGHTTTTKALENRGQYLQPTKIDFSKTGRNSCIALLRVEPRMISHHQTLRLAIGRNEPSVYGIATGTQLGPRNPKV